MAKTTQRPKKKKTASKKRSTRKKPAKKRTGAKKASSKRGTPKSTKEPTRLRPRCAVEQCTELVCGKEEMRDFCVKHYRVLCKHKTHKQLWDEQDEDGKAVVLELLQFKDTQMSQWYTYELKLTESAQYRWWNLQCKQHRVVYNFVWEHLDKWWEKNKGVPWAEKSPQNADSQGFYRRFAELVRSEPDQYAWAELCVANARNFAIKDAKAAWDRFLGQWKSRSKNPGAPKVGYPRTKRARDSHTFALQAAGGIEATKRWTERNLAERAIKIPKIGWVETKERIDITGRVTELQFEYHAGKYKVKLKVERGAKQNKDIQRPSTPRVIGLDMGLNAILTLSRPYEGDNPPPFLNEDRQTIEPPRPLEHALQRKRRLGRTWSRRESAGYRRKLFNLRDGPLPMSQWKGSTNRGAFLAMSGLALKLGHVEIEEDEKAKGGGWARLTPVGERQIENIAVRVYEKPDGKEAVHIPPSQRWVHQKKVLAKLDDRIASIRKDHLNKVSTWLVENYDVIVCEGFSVAELVKKQQKQTDEDQKAEEAQDSKASKKPKKLTVAEIKKAAYLSGRPLRERRRQMLDMGWGGLRERLTYKMKPHWYGGTFIQLDKHFATDRTCNVCGHTNEKKMSPYTNRFLCTSCGYRNTRQRNTALLCEGFGRTPDGSEEAAE